MIAVLKRMRPHCVVVPSSNAAEALPVGSVSVSVIPNPIRMLEDSGMATQGMEFFDESADCRLAFVGDIGERKGSLRVLQALADANERGCNAVAVLAGRAENPNVRSEHERMIVDRGLQDAVVLAGTLQPAELARLYDWADIFILPSSQEGVPLALLEAMARGLAPIVTPVGGIPEFVADQSTAIIVPPLDVSALSAAIFELATDAEKRIRIGKAAQEYAATTLGPDRIASLWAVAYRDAAGEAS